MGCIQSTPSSRKSGASAAKQVPASSNSKAAAAHQAGPSSGDAWLRERTTLTVILPISNPISFRRRTQLFAETVQRILRTDQRLAKKSSLARVSVLAVELAFDDDDCVSTPTAHGFSADEQCYRELSSPFCTGSYSTINGSYEALQFRASRSEATLWNKSNLVNLGLRHLLYERRFSRDSVVAWVDADVEWRGDGWVKATLAEFRNLELLSTAHRAMNPPQWPLLVQMFETAALLGPRGEKLRSVTSFGSQHAAGKSYESVGNSAPNYWHPGFAWASTLGAVDAVGGLIERTLGSEDRHMAMACVSKAAPSFPATIPAPYADMIVQWAERAVQVSPHRLTPMRAVRGGIHLSHHWHGDLANRKYVERWDILTRHAFSPFEHMRSAHSATAPRSLADIGLLTWDARASPALRHEVLQYFRERDEDSKICHEVASTAVVAIVKRDRTAGPSLCCVGTYDYMGPAGDVGDGDSSRDWDGGRDEHHHEAADCDSNAVVSHHHHHHSHDHHSGDASNAECGDFHHSSDSFGGYMGP